MKYSQSGQYIRDYIKQHPGNSGGSDLGTVGGFGAALNDGFDNWTENQVGGFGFSWTTSATGTSVTINNPVSNNSFWYHIPPWLSVAGMLLGLPIPYTGNFERSGSFPLPFSTIHQTFRYDE
jgi:hypothetical protein